MIFNQQLFIFGDLFLKLIEEVNVYSQYIVLLSSGKKMTVGYLRARNQEEMPYLFDLRHLAATYILGATRYSGPG